MMRGRRSWLSSPYVGDHASADTSPEVAGLLAASKEEMAYAGSVEAFCGGYAPQKDWEEYSFGLHTINSYIDLANDGVPGDPPPASEWHQTLNELGEARNQLCSNAEVELNERISARAAHLEADKRDLAAVLAAVKDVEEAEQVAEEAEHRAKWLEAMKMVSEVVEVIGNPHDFVEAETGFAIERLTHLTLAASTLKADFGSFIQAEAQYMVQVTLASHHSARPRRWNAGSRPLRATSRQPQRTCTATCTRARRHAHITRSPSPTETRPHQSDSFALLFMEEPGTIAI